MLVVSVRTLTLEELEAFAIVKRSRSKDEAKIVILKNRIQLMFESLIRFSDQRVSFIHSTIRDFFLKLDINTAHALSNTYDTNIALTHLALAEACINYLLLDEIFNNLFSENETFSTSIVSSTFSVIVAEKEIDDYATMFNIKNVMFLKNEENINKNKCSQIRTSLIAFDYAVTH